MDEYRIEGSEMDCHGTFLEVVRTYNAETPHEAFYLAMADGILNPEQPRLLVKGD